MALTLIGLLVASGALALVLWAPWSPDDSASESSKWTPVHRALCDAARDARAGNAAAARRVFYDHAHEPLHALARLAAVDHRDVAARLLEAKEQVEALLAAPTSVLPDQLRHLAQDTRGAAAAIGNPVSGSCPE